MPPLAGLRGLFGSRSPKFTPARLGPDWRYADSERVQVESGPLKGRYFFVTAELEPRRADFYLAERKTSVERFKASGDGMPDLSDPTSGIVAHTHFDRDPVTGLETHWEIFIRADHRGSGLSSLIVKLSYRRLLAAGGRRWFRIRKLMQVDSQRPELHNIGIGIIAVRIGMRPESGTTLARAVLSGGEPPDPPVEEILDRVNIKTVQVIEAGPAGPPGLFINLRRLPGVVVAAEFDEDGRPYPDTDHYRRLINPARLIRAAQSGRAVIGNIDYRLPRENIEHFCRHFAETPADFRAWVRSLRTGAQARRKRGRR